MSLNVILRRTTAVSLLAPSLKLRSEDEHELSLHVTKATPGGLHPDTAPQPVKSITQKHAATPGTNGIKGLQLDGRFVHTTDGSLPSTSEPGELGSAELEKETRQLLADFYLTYTGTSIAGLTLHHALPTMKRVVQDLIVKHEIPYKGMLRRLDLESQPDSLEFLSSVAKALFQDGVCNWGRVASLVAFGAQVCYVLKEQQRDHCILTVAQRIAHYLVSEQQQWLLSNNSWQGFEEFFQEHDVECVFRSALMVVLSCAGVGAGLALILR